MVDRISLDFSRFEARMAEIETRLLQSEAFLAQALVVVFKNEAIMVTIVEQLGEEKAHALVTATAAYIEQLNVRHGSGP